MELLSAHELKKRIESNDNRGTAQPYLLLLREKRTIVSNGEFCGKKKFVENISGDFKTASTRAELEDCLRKNYFDDENHEFKHGDITEYYEEEYEYTINVFLTDKGYQEHLDINSHNLKNHDTYGIHAFRNREMKSLIALIDECITLEKANNELKKNLKNLCSRALKAEQENSLLKNTINMIRNNSSDRTAVGYAVYCLNSLQDI